MQRLKYLILFLFIIITCGCTNQIKVISKDYFYFDTYINIKIYSNNSKLVTEALDKTENIFKEYHQLTDRYNAYEGINNLYYINNELNIKEKIKIDKRLYQLLETMVDFYDDSQGLVNIAIGNVIDVWKDYKDNNKGVPTYIELKNSGSTNINKLILDEDYYLYKLDNISLDLGAIVKGYVVELIGNYYEEIGLNKYLINAGGNVKVGDHYGDNRYIIGIENPVDVSNIFEIVKGNNVSIVSSGSYERFFEYKGKKYHHIIDPYTLFPPDYMKSVSVIHRDSGYADLLSTMLFLIPVDEGINYVNHLEEVEAIWYGIDDQIFYSKGFSQYE